MNGEFVLVILIIVGLVSRSPIITTAACILLIIKLVHLERYLPMVERRGLELGLLCLTIAVLVPLAAERISVHHITAALTSWPGILAIAGGAIATFMNGQGLHLLKDDPQMIVGLVAGSILGIVLLRGIPVGPLMAAGITALLIQISRWVSDKFL
ncbi:DUF441 domain-containing protein [Paenibacillus sp. 481]|uniref:DUF441 domain-containing protein n=1 Tax=Paenibacillus sp. 481 TaxID=2835869 RepID=UPI001E314D18|nr:DUF441 domain-containing protein [Paenibacillus sp. 481]UHA72865.1 DUF441 domain-containing protein [Paenibacillus sp. 481]